MFHLTNPSSLTLWSIHSTHKHIWCFRSIVFNCSKCTQEPRQQMRNEHRLGLIQISHWCKWKVIPTITVCVWIKPSEISRRKHTLSGLKFIHLELQSFNRKALQKVSSTNVINAVELTMQKQKHFTRLHISTAKCKVPVRQIRISFWFVICSKKMKFVCRLNTHLTCSYLIVWSPLKPKESISTDRP